MLTVSEFRARFPEFKLVPDGTIQAALDDAATRTDADVFGSSTNEAHGWLTADILASHPHGNTARHKLTNVPLPSMYALKRAELERIYCAGHGTL